MEWILCDERLPKEGQMVLTTIRGHDVIIPQEGETLEEAMERIWNDVCYVSIGFIGSDGWYGADGFPEVVHPIAWMPLPKPYKADRKTENSSEIPNNSTISKMEQVEDETQTSKIIEAYAKGYEDGADAVKAMPSTECRMCKHFKDRPNCGWECEYDTFEECNYEPKDEPQTDIHGITDCDFCKEKNCEDCEGGKNEPQTNKDFKVTYTCSFTECDNFKNFGFGEKCIECKRKQSEAKHKDEPQTYITEDRDTQILDAWQVHHRNTTTVKDEPQTDCAWR